MSRLFSYDAPLSRFLNLLGDLIVLNILWLLFSLPVVTAGAAATALYQALEQRRTGGVHPAAAFYAAFRAQLKRATLLWLPMLAWGGVLAVNFLLIPGLAEPAKGAFLGLTLVITLLYLALLSYLFPLLALLPTDCGMVLKNALLLCMGHPVHTLDILVTNLSPVLLLLVSPTWFFRLLALWLIIGGAALAYCNTVRFCRLLPVSSHL